MVENLLVLAFLIVGQVLHALVKTYEIDKATPDRSVTPIDVLFRGPELWKTIMLAVFSGAIALTGTALNLLAAAGITVADAGGTALLFISAGYNLDSLAAKAFSIAKPKASAQDSQG